MPGFEMVATSRVKIRAGVSFESAPVGDLEAGEVVRLLQVEHVSGQLRVRHARGWSSVRSAGSGRELLQLHSAHSTTRADVDLSHGPPPPKKKKKRTGDLIEVSFAPVNARLRYEVSCVLNDCSK